MGSNRQCIVSKQVIYVVDDTLGVHVATMVLMCAMKFAHTKIPMVALCGVTPSCVWFGQDWQGS